MLMLNGAPNRRGRPSVKYFGAPWKKNPKLKQSAITTGHFLAAIIFSKILRFILYFALIGYFDRHIIIVLLI